MSSPAPLRTQRLARGAHRAAIGSDAAAGTKGVPLISDHDEASATVRDKTDAQTRDSQISEKCLLRKLTA